MGDKTVEWIFFDLGSTLVDETEAYDRRAREMIAETDISFKEFDDARIALARKGLDGNSAAIEYFGLTKTPWHSEHELPYPDAHSTLAALCDKGYRLGVIANQNSGTRERLEKWGLLKFFDLVVASSDVGYSKPDRRIFEKAFEFAGCMAYESLMVGDRLDNDMIPAKALGMKTVWLKQGLARYQDTELGNEIADYQIYSLNEILSIL
ncbi:MAG: HAD family hydrolase [Clostridia bacterium]|nr:HAD family hydrolase [Clostridia bacterium]